MQKNRLIVYQAIKPCTLNTANNRETIPHNTSQKMWKNARMGQYIHYTYSSRSTKHFSNEYYLPRISTTC